MAYPDNLTRAETRARAELIHTHAYRLEIDLTGRHVADPDTQFSSTATITFTARRDGALHVDLVGEAVTSASLDSRPLDPAGFASSRLPLEVTAGDHELTVSAVFRYSRTGEGLHRFMDPADGRSYLYTQFEPANARRVYPCFEQPDLKATFSTTVHAPETWTVISNGAERARTATGDGNATWEFAETARVSTYLTALVAGDYHRVETSYAGAGGEVPMALVCRRSLAEHLDAERLFAITQQGFGVFEEHFGVPYPFGKYDQVFVPEYNGGAMENIGCVTIRDDYVFRSRVTPASYQVRDDTLLHELSHMWFGDLVTMAWWDDLWLKESFATWAANYALAELADDPDEAWAGFTNGFKTWAFRQDQLPSTHPIAADIVDLEAVEENFDGITYAKGASVLQQLVAFVGRPGFLAGARAYFAQHAYRNTTLADLLAALEQTSDRDLSHWSAEWLETTGVNTLRPVVETAADGTITAFAVQQTATASAPTLRSHRIAIGLYDRGGDGLLRRTERTETDVTGASTPVPQLVGRTRPALILVNDDDLTYAKLRLDPYSLATVRSGLAEISSPLARAVCWAAAWDMCRDAELAAADYVELVLSAVATESDHTAVRSTLQQGLQAARHYTPRARRPAVLLRWQQGVGDLLAAAAAGSDHQLALAKAFPMAAEDEAAADRLQGWLEDRDVPEGLAIDPELRWSVVVALARLGRLDANAIAAEEERDKTITGAQQAVAARAARPTAPAKAEAWDLAVHSDSVPNGKHQAACLAFWQRGQADVLEPYAEAYLTAAADISANRGGWQGRGHALRSNVLRYLFPVPEDLQPFLVRLDAWLAEQDLSESVHRTITECRDNALRALRCQTAGG